MQGILFLKISKGCFDEKVGFTKKPLASIYRRRVTDNAKNYMDRKKVQAILLNNVQVS